MFNNGKNTYLKRIEELELLLEQQKRENMERETELKRFREQEQFQQESFQEIKLAMGAKLKILDNRMREFDQEKKQEEFRMESEKAQMRQRLKEEAETARNALKHEIEEERKLARERLQEQVRSFHQAYCQYLADIQSQIELLMQTSIRVSDCFSGLDAVDVKMMFEAGMGKPDTRVAIVSSAEPETARSTALKQEQPNEAYEQTQPKTTTDLPRTGERRFIYGDEEKERVERVMSLLGGNEENP